MCCNNLMEVDRRKWKKGGKEKEEKANQNLEALQSRIQQTSVVNDQYRASFNEVVSKMKKVKVKKEVKGSEVD